MLIDFDIIVSFISNLSINFDIKVLFINNLSNLIESTIRTKMTKTKTWTLKYILHNKIDNFNSIPKIKDVMKKIFIYFGCYYKNNNNICAKLSIFV